jgi:hypothetical protein
MDIGRQTDAGCNQRNCHDKSQRVYDQAVPIIVFLDIALVLGKAQERRNVRVAIMDELPPPCRPFRIGASRPDADDTTFVIARLKRTEDQVTTFRHHHVPQRLSNRADLQISRCGRQERAASNDAPSAIELTAARHFAREKPTGFRRHIDFRNVNKNPSTGLPGQEYISDRGKRPGGAPASTRGLGGMPRPGPALGEEQGATQRQTNHHPPGWNERSITESSRKSRAC